MGSSSNRDVDCEGGLFTFYARRGVLRPTEGRAGAEYGSPGDFHQS